MKPRQYGSFSRRLWVFSLIILPFSFHFLTFSQSRQLYSKGTLRRVPHENAAVASHSGFLNPVVHPGREVGSSGVRLMIVRPWAASDYYGCSWTASLVKLDTVWLRKKKEHMDGTERQVTAGHCH